MAANDLTDPRSRDQYPVDDDQDGQFVNIDSDEAVLHDDEFVAPGQLPSGFHPADDYEGRETYNMSNDYTDTSDAQGSSGDDSFQQGQGGSGGGYNAGTDDGSGDAVSRFQDVHAQVGADQVRDAATDHFSNVDQDQFQQSVQQGVSSIGDHQVGGIAGTVLGALEQAGIPAQQVAQEAGLSSDQPHQMDKGDLSSLLGYAQQFAPEALGGAVAGSPGIAGALGNPIVKGLLGKFFG